MKKFIVTTTINKPTIATLKFIDIAVRDNWMFIIVGDTKTPHEEYEKLQSKHPSHVLYMHPDLQNELYSDISEALGWRTIQRRNVGFIHAYKKGADIMATVDDDNIPYDDWGKNLYVNSEIDVDLWESENGYFDPLSVSNRSDLWHRGYPIELIPTKNNVQYKGKVNRKVLVQADLWDGDPDIDAMCRLTKKPIVKYDDVAPYSSDQPSPFNSQNTFLAREIIPYYMVLPFVGRMDDIWISYMIQELFPKSVIYNKASVYQNRNEQDLIRNLENEIIGYRNTLSFINNKFDLPEETIKCYNLYKQQFK
jgi:hypothetical protein